MADPFTYAVLNFGGFGVLGLIAYLLIKWLMGKYDQLLKATLDNMTTLTKTIENHLKTLVEEEREVCRNLEALGKGLDTHNRGMDEFHKDLERRLTERGGEKDG